MQVLLESLCTQVFLTEDKVKKFLMGVLSRIGAAQKVFRKLEGFFSFLHQTLLAEPNPDKGPATSSSCCPSHWEGKKASGCRYSGQLAVEKPGWIARIVTDDSCNQLLKDLLLFPNIFIFSLLHRQGTQTRRIPKYAKRPSMVRNSFPYLCSGVETIH